MVGVSGSNSATGLATRSRSSTTRSTASATRPRLGRERAGDRHLGHAERREHRARGEPEARRLGDERLDRLRVDRLAHVTGRSASTTGRARRRAAAAWRAPRRSSGRRRRAAVLADPLHPAGRMGQEVLRRRLHGRDPEAHREGDEADQTHVVVERQPRHHHLDLGSELGRLRAAPRFALRTRSGIITPFGSLVEPLVNCRITIPRGRPAAAPAHPMARSVTGITERSPRSAGRRARA